MPWITALVEYGPSNTAHVKYGPPIDSHYLVASSSSTPVLTAVTQCTANNLPILPYTTTTTNDTVSMPNDLISYMRRPAAACQTSNTLPTMITSCAETTPPINTRDSDNANARKIKQLEKKMAELKIAKEHAECQSTTARAYIATLEQLLTQKDESLRLRREQIVSLELELSKPPLTHNYSATYTKPQSHTQPMSSEFAQNVNTHSDNMSLLQEQQHQFAVSNLQSQRDLANAQRDAALFQLQLNREALAFSKLMLPSYAAPPPQPIQAHPLPSGLPLCHGNPPRNCRRRNVRKLVGQNAASQQPSGNPTHCCPPSTPQQQSSGNPTQSQIYAQKLDSPPIDWRHDLANLTVNLPDAPVRTSDIPASEHSASMSPSTNRTPTDADQTIPKDKHFLGQRRVLTPIDA